MKNLESTVIVKEKPFTKGHILCDFFYTQCPTGTFLAIGSRLVTFRAEGEGKWE